MPCTQTAQDAAHGVEFQRMAAARAQNVPAGVEFAHGNRRRIGANGRPRAAAADEQARHPQFRQIHGSPPNLAAHALERGVIVGGDAPVVVAAIHLARAHDGQQAGGADDGVARLDIGLLPHLSVDDDLV